MTIYKFIDQNKAAMLQSLESVVKDLKATIKSDPEEFTDYGCDDPSIDVRLCIDLTPGQRLGYIFRTGLVDYDPYHSEYCASSCVTLDTNAAKLLDELINQIEE